MPGMANKRHYQPVSKPTSERLADTMSVYAKPGAPAGYRMSLPCMHATCPAPGVLYSWLKLSSCGVGMHPPWSSPAWHAAVKLLTDGIVLLICFIRFATAPADITIFATWKHKQYMRIDVLLPARMRTLQQAAFAGDGAARSGTHWCSHRSRGTHSCRPCLCSQHLLGSWLCRVHTR